MNYKHAEECRGECELILGGTNTFGIGKPSILVINVVLLSRKKLPWNPLGFLTDTSGFGLPCCSHCGERSQQDTHLAIF